MLVQAAIEEHQDVQDDISKYKHQIPQGHFFISQIPQEHAYAAVSKRTCPVCKVSITDVGNMKSHLSSHLIYDIDKRKILTHDGQEWTQLILQYIDHDQSNVWEAENTSEGQRSSLVNLISTDDFLFKCLLCNVKFIEPRELISHRSTQHKDIKVTYGPNKDCLQLKQNRYTCKLCGMRVLSMRDHMKFHADPDAFKCGICNIQFGTSSHLKVHMKIHSRKEGEQRNVCEVCGKRYWHKAHLNSHMKKIHMGDTKNLRCGICKLEFATYKKYITHYRMQHKNGSSNLCDICGIAFPLASSLKIHKFYKHTNLDLPKYRDRMSDKERNRMSDKERNEKRNQRKEQRFECDICKKTFSTKCGSILHKKTVHSDDRPFKCEVCLKTFKTRASLDCHKSIHTGIKPYKCSVCHERFRRKDFYQDHYRKHTGEKPYACQVCGHRFRKKADHTTHLQLHAKRGECSLVKARTSQNMDFMLPTNISNEFREVDNELSNALLGMSQVA